MGIVQLLEEFVKSSIINEFESKTVLEENIKIQHIPEFSKTNLRFTSEDGSEKGRTFTIIDIAFWNHKNLECNLYTITGCVCKNGRIVIHSYNIEDKTII